MDDGKALGSIWQSLLREFQPEFIRGGWVRLMRVIDEVRPAPFGGYRVMAIDDTKEHRTSPEVWGTSTFHESSARSPNRAY